MECGLAVIATLTYSVVDPRSLRRETPFFLQEHNQLGQSVFPGVGCVEFYETHQLPRFVVGLAELDPPYKLRN